MTIISGLRLYKQSFQKQESSRSISRERYYKRADASHSPRPNSESTFYTPARRWPKTGSFAHGRAASDLQAQRDDSRCARRAFA